MINANIEAITLDSNATSMPQGKHTRPRINFAISHESKDALEQWAKEEHRTVSNLVEALTEEALKTKQIKSNASLSVDDLDQIKKFVALLLGDRDRDGISFALVGQTLGIEAERLQALYRFITKCRKANPQKKESSHD